MKKPLFRHHNINPTKVVRDLSSAKDVKEMFAQHGAKPSKMMGQNFLVHAPTLEKIIEAADISKDDVILEVGPGIGTLTQTLAQKAKRVIVVEKDRAMVEILTKNTSLYDNVEIVTGDALSYKLQERKYKVVANIPYYLTSPLIRQFLESQNPPTQIILMIQKEVAKRICAQPPEMSILAVSVQFYAEAKIISNVSKECFWPAPKVDSAIIKITPHAAKPDISPELFFKVVKAGFLHPRKQLANNFSKIFGKDKIPTWLAQNSIAPNQRAETLTLGQWKALTQTLDMVK